MTASTLAAPGGAFPEAAAAAGRRSVKADYAAASVPMLPVVAPASVVARKILIYSYVMVASTLALAPTPDGYTRSARPAWGPGSSPRHTGCAHAWPG